MSPLWNNIFRLGHAENSLASFLELNPVFSELSSREKLFLSEYFHARRYKAGEAIFTEGDIGSGFYLIRTGLVRLFVEPPGGDVVELARLEPGDFFGETTLCENSSRLYSASAVESAEMAGMFRSDLEQLANDRPTLCIKVLSAINKILSRRIQAMESLHQELFVPEKAVK